MNKKILFLTVVLMALPFFLFGQSSGKIVGVVTDKANGEPLPGVNINLEGTTFGAATDVDGYYVILNVPVGVYDIRASFIGYGDVIKEGIRVSASTTREVNFELAEAAIEGQAVVITAERPLVEKHVTQSVSLVTSDELENIPVRGFNEVMALQNSVVVQDGEVFIRGGRSDEVGYYLDGASSTSPVSNTNVVYVIQEAVEEFQVLAGGYNAEFGGANAGIIRTELRTGSSKYKASVDFQTDKFASEGGQFLDTYSYRHHVAVATLSGPLFSKNIRFFIAGENADQGDRDVRFSKGFTFNGLVDSNPDNPNVAAGNPDVVDLTYPDGFTPQRSFTRWALNGTLLFDYSPIRVRVSGVYKDETSQNTNFLGTNTPMLNILNERYNEDIDKSVLLGLKMTHVLSPKTLYSLKLNYFKRTLDREDSYLGNNWKSWYDSAAVYNATNGQVVYRDAYRPQYAYRLNGIPFARNGQPNAVYRKQDEQYIGGALDFTTQMSRYHEIKIGFDARRYELRRFALNPSAISLLQQDIYNTLDDIPADVWARSARPNNYGYDFFGNELNDGFDAPKNPLFAAFYVQDKIEYNDLIINVGLRFDHFDTDDRRLKNPENPQRGPDEFILASEWEDVDPFQQISPRLGFSFPVSDKTVFYMQYGKFIQMTELNNIYFGTFAYAQQIVISGNYFQNPVGYGLEPTRTTSYEIGFRKQLSQVAAIDISGFYRNIRGQIQVGAQDVDPTSGLSRYSILQNGDFATTKGLDFKLTLRRTNRLQGQLNYTYSQAEGTGSNENSYRSALERATPVPTTVSPLDFNQAHTGSINLDYRYGKNDGGPILENLGLNVLFTFSSGHAYTFAEPLVGGQADPYTAGTDYMADTRSRKAREALGASTTPWNFLTDLRIDKAFNLTDKLRATLYMRVQNFFNSKNVINVFPNTGSADDDGFISNRAISQATIDANGGEEYVQLYRAINLENGQAYWDATGNELYGSPRQIFFGIKLNY